MKPKIDLLAVTAQQLKKPNNVKFNQEAALQKAAQTIPKLHDVKSIKGTQFLNRGFLNAYYLDIVHGNDKQDKMVAFVFPTINVQVLAFLVNAAKSDAINGLVGFTENVCVVKQYKI